MVRLAMRRIVRSAQDALLTVRNRLFGTSITLIPEVPADTVPRS